MNGTFSSLLVNKLISNGKKDRRLKENPWLTFLPCVEEIFLHTPRDGERISCLLRQYGLNIPTLEILILRCSSIQSFLKAAWYFKEKTHSIWLIRSQSECNYKEVLYTLTFKL